MDINLRGRSLAKLLDFTPDEIRFLLRLSADLKAAKKNKTERQQLVGKNIATRLGYQQVIVPLAPDGACMPSRRYVCVPADTK